MGKQGKRNHLHASKTDTPPAVEARIFLQDPQVAQTADVGLTTVEVKGEPWLGQGPTSARFRVLDRDDKAKRTHPAVRVNADGTGFAVGRGKPATSYAFHQVNVWATVSRLLDHLESPKVFGRRIPWAFPSARLELRPHAAELENAYYERESGSVRFGYFDSEDGNRVYTCLSHDVIAHEFGHAVLDGLKPYYQETDGPDGAAFHEYFGDAVAMASALTMRDLMKKLLRRGGGKTGRDTLRKLHWITDLMEEWGSAYGDRFIRSARNRKTVQKLRSNFFEHDRSGILSGAYYDIFRAFFSYLRKREPEADALINAADHASRLVFRAVDYCPPAGLDFQVYATAMLRADEVAYPADDRGYRTMVKKVLKRRGIKPAPARELSNEDLRPYDLEQLAASETDAYVFVDRNREALGIPRDVNFRVTRVFGTCKTAAQGFNPPREIIIEFVWREGVRLKGSGLGDMAGTISDMWCGGTLVMDTNGNVLHYVLVDDNEDRRKLHHRYLRFMVREGYFSGEEEGSGHDARRARAVVRPDKTMKVVRNPAARCASRRRRRRPRR
jgi:hypothetical protein